METSIQEQADAGMQVVNAQLNYLAEATPKPVNYAYDPPAGVPRSSGKHVAQNVTIRNGREVLDELSLDTNGFVLTPHETAVRDFYDSEEVKSVYYPEVERLLKRVTGAERVLIFDHVVRNPVLAERGEKGARSPAKIVHNDYSFKSAPRRVRDLLPEEADRLLKNRFAEINAGVRFAARSKVRLSRCATPAACVRRMSCPVIWSIASGWAKPTASPTTRHIAGTISRDWNVTKQSC
jgi:hypothetical protein